MAWDGPKPLGPAKFRRIERREPSGDVPYPSMWMLPQPRAYRTGQDVSGWTSRRVAFATGPEAGKATAEAFNLLSAAESDLRRAPEGEGWSFTSRRSLAALLVVLAMALLPAEWALFHRRVTE